MEKNRLNGYAVLIIDDEEGIRHGLTNLFNKEGFIVYPIDNFESAISIARKNEIDIALIDIRLKNNRNGIDLLKKLKLIDKDLLVIMITGYGSIDSAVRAMKEGASDYILKPIDNIKLIDTVYKNLELRNLKSENDFLKSELFNKYKTGVFITNNNNMKSLLSKADKIKNSPVTVLITGESGCGKEIFSRYIHFTSNRKDEKFVSINCAALSESLLLSELFGHEKGAFTGAIEKKLGKFEIADNGTLFLDEIGDMSLETQAKLLRVIEKSSFERLGGTKKINVNLRLITATNKDLKCLIKEGRFREDLYYRINVISFHLLPLRERKDDIPILIDYFTKKCNERYNKNVKKFNDSAIEKLLLYDWPGNIRELENYINRIVLLCDKEIITEDDLKNNIITGENNSNEAIDLSEIRSLKEKIDDITETYEKKIIKNFLIKNNYNRTKTSKDLHITRKTLRIKMNKYNLTDQ